MKKLFVLIFYLICFASCNSIKQYNEQIAKLHAVEDLHTDIDKVYSQLKKHHPKLYQYTSKAVLDFKFDSLKASINEPINSRDFYKRIVPVVINVRQGHISMGSANKRYTKKERKQLKKKKFEFYDLDFEYLDNKLWVKTTRGKDSTIIGSEVVKIDNDSVSDLIETYKTRFSSDGYNTTLHNRYIGRAFPNFYFKDKGFKDSLKIHFKQKESLFAKTFRRIPKEDKTKKTEQDSLKKETPNKLTKVEKETAKLTKKKKKKDNRIYGYLAKRKQYTRNFNLIGEDSTVAYMKIRGFSNGNYRKFYKQSFIMMDSLNIENFILDLRDNGGGRIAEVDKLYSYLTNDDYVFINSTEVNSRLPIMKSLLSNSNPNILKVFGSLLGLNPIALTAQYLQTKKEDDKLYFKMKYLKQRKPNALNYKGNMYVLINGNSFSASSLISTHLKATKRAVFVGEETGGAYNGCVAGFYKIYQLPNTKLKIRIGLMQIEAPHKQNPDGYGVKPDIELTPTIEHRREKYDVELEWVLKTIANKK